MTNRTFEDKPAKRERVPLLIGLVGPSGGGKTGSALELAHGIQAVTGGDIFYIDTEAKRALHYAEAPAFSDKSKSFNFRHLAFGAPFSPLDYLAAIEHCIKRGAKTIVVDSMSHEHEGPGGVLEMHESELDRIAGSDWAKRDKSSMLAWQKPKAERRKLINAVLQYPVNLIFCFRAKEKIKIIPGKAPEAKGWQPIAGEEFVFEMTLNFLLPPSANGVPEWSPEEKAERQMIKLPQQFRNILTPGRPLSIAVGIELAKWAEGGAMPAKQVSHPAQPVQKDPESLGLGIDHPQAEIAPIAIARNSLKALVDKFHDRLPVKGMVLITDALNNPSTPIDRLQWLIEESRKSLITAGVNLDQEGVPT